MKWIICFLFINVFIMESIVGQLLPQINRQYYVDSVFYFEHKNISEFLNRFNFNDTVYHSLFKTQNRKDRIALFFNQYKKDWDRQKLESLIKVITSDSLELPKLSLMDSTTYAVLSVDIRREERRENIELVLKFRASDILPTGREWVLSSLLKSSLSNNRKFWDLQMKVCNDSSVFIDPAQHWQQFISLPSVINNNRQCIRNFIEKINYLDYRPIYFFSSLVYNGQLTILNTKDLYFLFLIDPSWVIKVEYFNRRSYNSGWLVSDIIKLNGGGFKYFKNEMLNIPY